MVNDITTISGAAQEVIDHLEQHLTNKGVIDAQYNPVTGILGLVNRIPDIEPSVNINLTIDLSLTSSASTIHYGESVVLTATLLASYEGVSEVDLQTGEITGATILFKNGSTIIGTGTTDSNGVATLTYTPTVSETTLSINAVFEGTDNFNRASSHNVSIEVNDYLDLTSDKDILSYVDGDEAVLTATLYSPDKIDKTVTFEVRKQSDDSLIETLTAVTDNSGIATVSYTSKGASDIYIKAECMFVSKIYEIEDCVKTYMGTYLTGKDTQVQYFNLPLPSTFKIEYEWKSNLASATSTYIAIGESDSRAVLFGRVGGNDTVYKSYVRTNSTGSGDIIQNGSSITDSNEFIPLFIEYDGSKMNLNDDITITNFNGVNLTQLVKVQGWHYTINGMIRNIKIKPL